MDLGISTKIDLSILSDEEMKNWRALVDKARTRQLAAGNGDQAGPEDRTDPNSLKSKDDPRTYCSDVDV